MKKEEDERLEDYEFGVCDSPQQLADKFPTFRGIVWMTPIRREDEPKEGGWRWRKWGDYVGEFTVDAPYNGEWVTYLGQCDGKDGRQLIDEQYVFHTVKPKQNVLGLEAYRAYMIFDGKFHPLDKFVKDKGIMSLLRQNKQ